MGTFVKELECDFLVESTMIEKTIFSYKSALWQIEWGVQSALWQIKWRVQNEPFTNKKVLSVITLFLNNLVSVWEPLGNSWFNTWTTQMFMFSFFWWVFDFYFRVHFSMCVSLALFYAVY